MQKRLSAKDMASIEEARKTADKIAWIFIAASVAILAMIFLH